MNRMSPYIILALLIAGQGMALAANETNKPVNLQDFNSYKIISDRNIFNAARSKRSTRSTVKPRQPKIEFFALRGTLAYPKGQHAIFDTGSKEKDLKLGDEINNYRISQITFDHVLLTPAKGDPIKLSIGMQMRREDGGPWALGGRSEPAAVPAASSSAASSDKPADSPAGGSGEDEILRRLMEKRRQQLKQ